MIKLIWNSSNRDWYIDKGYEYTKLKDVFYVNPKDLMPKSKSMVCVLCDYCGEEYRTQYATYYNGHEKYPKDACKHCASKKSREVSIKKYAKKYFDKVRSVCNHLGYILITKENEYTGSGMRVQYICPKHGLRTTNISNLSNGHGCLLCADENRGSYLKYTPNDVERIVNETNENILLNKDDYKNCYTYNLNIKCKCGNVFTTNLTNYIRHNVNRCPACSSKESNGEFRIRNYLDNNDIEYIQEFRFNDCRDKKPLPFDFYLRDRNLIIEYDGMHHYQKTYYGDYEKTVEHDKIKNQYCKDNGIDILRIPFWEYNSIEEILSNKLNI